MNELNIDNIREHINNMCNDYSSLLINDLARRRIYDMVESKKVYFSEAYNKYKSLKENKENNISDEEVKGYFNL